LLYFCGAAVRAFVFFYERAHEATSSTATRKKYIKDHAASLAGFRFQISSVRGVLEVKFGTENPKNIDELLPPLVPRPASIDSYYVSAPVYENELNDQVTLWRQKREREETFVEEEEEEEEGE